MAVIDTWKKLKTKNYKKRSKPDRERGKVQVFNKNLLDDTCRYSQAEGDKSATLRE